MRCLAGGFARFRCARCGVDRLVPFSCKGRGFCPSCCGRRISALTAHLVDGVLGGLPVRQWVLTLPHRLRYGRLRLVATIEARAVIEKILAHLGLPLDPPRPDPAQSPAITANAASRCPGARRDAFKDSIPTSDT